MIWAIGTIEILEIDTTWQSPGLRHKVRDDAEHHWYTAEITTMCNQHVVNWVAAKRLILKSDGTTYEEAAAYDYVDGRAWARPCPKCFPEMQNG